MSQEDKSSLNSERFLGIKQFPGNRRSSLREHRSIINPFASLLSGHETRTRTIQIRAYLQFT